MIRKASNIVTIINVAFEIVMLLGVLLDKIAPTEVMYIYEYVLYIFRPEYYLVSGFMAFLLAVIFLVLIIISIIKKNFRIKDVVMLGLNIQYLVFWRFIYIPMG